MAFNAKEHLNKLIDIRDRIDLNKVTILTGGNGKGKSLIRKQVMGICYRDKIKVWSCSMDKRAGLDDSLGGGNVFNRDCEWLPTSINTLDSFKGFYKYEGTFGVLDEIEIGMAEESQAGVAIYINKHLEEYRAKNRGMLIITHSKYLASMIEADEFINIEGMSREEWLNREIVPTDFDKLEEESNELYREVCNRTKRR